MTQNFNNAKIYKITNDYNDDIYVGSTCDTLIKRYSGHKKMSKNEKYINVPLYKLMNEIGFERFRIDLIEDYPCNDKMSLRQREGHFIREIGTLNMCIAGRTDKEYRQDNADVIKDKSKIYYEANKDKLKEYQLTNAEKIKEYQKEYRQTNADKSKEYKALYYQTNADKINEKRRLNYIKKQQQKLP